MLTVLGQQWAHVFATKYYSCCCMSFPLDGNESSRMETIASWRPLLPGNITNMLAAGQTANAAIG